MSVALQNSARGLNTTKESIPTSTGHDSSTNYIVFNYYSLLKYSHHCGIVDQYITVVSSTRDRLKEKWHLGVAINIQCHVIHSVMH